MIDDDPTKGQKWNPYSAGCPCREVLATISDKWALLIMGALGNGPARFNGLGRVIEGVSPKMLAHTLRRLERHGLISRTAFPTVPVTVEYAMTDVGRSLEAVLKPLRTWTVDNMAVLTKAQAVHDRAGTNRA